MEVRKKLSYFCNVQCGIFQAVLAAVWQKPDSHLALLWSSAPIYPRMSLARIAPNFLSGISARRSAALLSSRHSSSFLPHHESFVRRHVGPSAEDQQKMLKFCGLKVGFNGSLLYLEWCFDACPLRCCRQSMSSWRRLCQRTSVWEGL